MKLRRRKARRLRHIIRIMRESAAKFHVHWALDRAIAEMFPCPNGVDAKRPTEAMDVTLRLIDHGDPGQGLILSVKRFTGPS